MIDATTIDDLKARHGDVLTLLTSGRGDEVIVRNPKPAECERWRAQVGDPQKRHLATPALFKSIVVYPEGEALAALLARQPLLPEEFAEAVVELAGLTGEATAKKL